MAVTVGFHIARDVRLRAIRRGSRSPFGPRLTYVRQIDDGADVSDPAVGQRDGADTDSLDDADLPHTGSPSADSDQAGDDTQPVMLPRNPLTEQYHQLSGGGRAEPAVIEGADAWLGSQRYLDRLLAMHQSPHHRAQPPILPQPPAINRTHVRQQLRQESVDGVPAWRLMTRLKARKDADLLLADELEHRQQQQDQDHAAAQQAADDWWQRLLDADLAVVRDRLLTAFAANELPAVPTAVTDRVAHIVIGVDTAEMLIGEREPIRNGTAAMSLAIMSQGKRNKLYVQAICTLMLTVAAECFAVAPGIETVSLAVAAPTRPTGPAVLALADLPRAYVLPEGADMPPDDNLIEAAQRGQVRLILERSDIDDAPQPLDAERQAVAAVLDALVM